MKTLAFGVLLLLHGGLFVWGGEGGWRFEICMKNREKRAGLWRPLQRGGGGWKRGSKAPPPSPSKFFGSPSMLRCGMPPPQHGTPYPLRAAPTVCRCSAGPRGSLQKQTRDHRRSDMREDSGGGHVGMRRTPHRPAATGLGGVGGMGVHGPRPPPQQRPPSPAPVPL